MGPEVLLVDLGNTNLKWARWRGGQLGPVAAVGHRDRPLPVLLQERWQEEPAPGRMLVSNVAGPEAAEALRRWTGARWGLAPGMVRPGARMLGVENGYGDPERLGVDRLLAMGAAWGRLGRAFCLVDCGTAITLDAVDASGCHLGGLILPGFAMMRWALERGTAIPPLGEPAGLELLARDTATAVESAPVHALAALLRRVVDSMAGTAARPAVVLTGSAAERLQPALDLEFEPMENLVIEGLALLAGQSERP
jgi:type III pantothenate kinase